MKVSRECFQKHLDHFKIHVFKMSMKNQTELDDDFIVECSRTLLNFQRIEKLLDDGADIHCHRNMALWSAVDFGNLELVTFLIEHGADMHIKNVYNDDTTTSVFDYAKEIANSPECDVECRIQIYDYLNRVNRKQKISNLV